MIPAIGRVLRSALMLLSLTACGGGGDEPGPSFLPGSIVGPWTLTAIGGEALPGIVPGTDLVLFDGTATFAQSGTFRITYNGALDGRNIVVQVNGTWVADGGTFRLFGQATLDGEPLEQGYTNTGGVPDRTLTLYASPAETWDRPT